MRDIGVGLLGLGNVGAGVIKLLEDNAPAIQARLGARLVVRAVAVRSPDKDRLVAIDRALLTTDVSAVIARDDVDIVCELMGGAHEARTAALDAIAQRKHVVTANKALLSLHGDAIFAAAERADVDVYYEAAVCGGVPVIRALRDGLASDRIHTIHGIVNGTSNFILSTMARTQAPFAEVLADAQEHGYAEADPGLDVGGMDAAHKLAILIMLCFGARVHPDAIFVEGIDRVQSVDFHYAERFGYVIKPLVIARQLASGIEARVHPAMIPQRWLLAAVSGANNALYVQSYALGPSLYYGAGAGMMPTAMATVSDLIEVARNILAGATGTLPLRNRGSLDESRLAPPLVPIDELRGRYYMRFSVLDRPGVLGQITTILGEHEISIAQVVQEGPPDPGRPVRVVALSHEALEGNVQRALARISAMDAVAEPAAVIRIVQ